MSDTMGRSEATGLPQRTLEYPNSLRLKFSPAVADSTDGDWSFTNAWDDRLPVTAREIAGKMPCFGAALKESAAAAPAATEVNTVPAPHGAFGIANLWLIVALAAFVFLLAMLVPSRRRMVLGPDAKLRPFRQPKLTQPAFRRFRRAPDLTRPR